MQRTQQLQAGEMHMSVGQVLARSLRLQAFARPFILCPGQVRPGTVAIAAVQGQPIAGGLDALSAFVHPPNAFFQVRLSPARVTGEEVGIAQPGEDLATRQPVSKVRKHPSVQLDGFEVAATALGFLRCFDAHRDGLLPAASRQQMVGQIYCVRARLLPKDLGATSVQLFPPGRDEVFVDGLPSERMAEAILASSLRKLLRELLLNEVVEGGLDDVFVPTRNCHEGLICEGFPQHGSDSEDLCLVFAQPFDPEQDRVPGGIFSSSSDLRSHRACVR